MIKNAEKRGKTSHLFSKNASRRARCVARIEKKFRILKKMVYKTSCFCSGSRKMQYEPYLRFFKKTSRYCRAEGNTGSNNPRIHDLFQKKLVEKRGMRGTVCETRVFYFYHDAHTFFLPGIKMNLIM